MLARTQGHAMNKNKVVHKETPQFAPSDSAIISSNRYIHLMYSVV